MIKKRKTKPKPIARLVIDGPGKMTKAQRRDIAAWLRDNADRLLKFGDHYTDAQFRAGFNYV